MKKFVLAIILLQVVQCTTPVKREDDDQGFITGKYFQQICGELLRARWNDRISELSNNKPNINYMYPCEKCTSALIEVEKPKHEKLFYKYDEKSDFFVTNLTFRSNAYEDCECQLNPREEDIAKAIDAYEKEHLNCSKTNAAKEKGFDLDPAKLKECFQSTEGGESKVRLAVRWISMCFSVLVQEILDKGKEKVTYNVLQKKMSPVWSLEVFRIDDKEGEHKDQKIVECLKKTNFFNAGAYRILDYLVKCGEDKDQMFFRREVDFEDSCRDGAFVD